MGKDDLKVMFVRVMTWLNISVVLYFLFASIFLDIDLEGWNIYGQLAYLGLVLILMKIIVARKDYGKQP